MKSSAPRQERHKNTDTSSKTLKNSNGEIACQMKLDEFSKGLGTYRELTLVYSSTGTKSPNMPKSHISTSSATDGPKRKRRTEYVSLWEEIESPLMDQSPPQHLISPPQNFIGTDSYRPHAPGISWLTSITFIVTTSWRSMNHTILPSV